MRVGKVDKRVLGPVLMGFFIMGFCDMVAPITGRIALEFPASRQAAVSFLPTMVFLWFLVLSTPLAALMNRIGRKATALIGYAFTVVGLMVPYAAGEGCALGWYFAGFGLLGVGNTAIQVAINPLLATIVPGERMTSYLTVGQIFRNTSLLLLAPIVTALVALTGSWRLLLPIYAGLTVLGGLWLQATSVAEPPRSDRAAGMADCFRLLGNPTVLLCTLGVACFIAGDVGIGFLSVRLIDNPDSILTTTGFYACRIVGTLVGAWVLVRVSDVKYLRWNMAGALALCAVLLLVRKANQTGAPLCAELIYGDSNTRLTFPLEKDADYDVDTGYLTVHIKIQDGAARFVDSPCPDHICESFGWLSEEDQTATCLPARAVLSIIPTT